MKFLMKITFNVLINGEYQIVEHLFDSYIEDENTLTLFDENKTILSSFQKKYVLNKSISENLEQKNKTEIINKKKKNK